jgi:hypothetical protein
VDIALPAEAETRTTYGVLEELQAPQSAAGWQDRVR